MEKKPEEEPETEDLVVQVLKPEEQPESQEVSEEVAVLTLEKKPEEPEQVTEILQEATIPEEPAKEQPEEEEEHIAVLEMDKVEVPEEVIETKMAPVFVKKLKNTDTVETQTVSFECVVKGTPAPEVTWYQDRNPVTDQDRFKPSITEDGICTLTIENVAIEDDAEYMCKATNPLGEATTMAELFVESKYT